MRRTIEHQQAKWFHRAYRPIHKDQNEKVTGGSYDALNRHAQTGFRATTTTPTASPMLPRGREDDGTGLYYYRARYYHPGLSRFISEDPLGIAAGPNVYAYVGGNPVPFGDPLGLTPIDLPPLQLIHSDATYSQPGTAKSSYDFHSTKPTGEIVRSLVPGAREPLRVTPDGRVYDGNTRVRVLQERGVDVNKLPRVIIPPTIIPPMIPILICPICRFIPEFNDPPKQCVSS